MTLGWSNSEGPSISVSTYLQKTWESDNTLTGGSRWVYDLTGINEVFWQRRRSWASGHSTGFRRPKTRLGPLSARHEVLRGSAKYYLS
jgi:hypothetical protein